MKKIYFYNVYDKEVQCEEYDKHENGTFLKKGRKGMEGAGYCNTHSAYCLNDDVEVVIEYAKSRIKNLENEIKITRESIKKFEEVG